MSSKKRSVCFEPFVNNVAFVSIVIVEPRVRSAAKVSDFGYFLHRLSNNSYRVKKANRVAAGQDDTYEVHIGTGSEKHTCTCKAGKFHGHCKHVDSILALINAGKIQ